MCGRLGAANVYKAEVALAAQGGLRLSGIIWPSLTPNSRPSITLRMRIPQQMKYSQALTRSSGGNVRNQLAAMFGRLLDTAERKELAARHVPVEL